MKRLTPVSLALVLSGCDYSGDFLFPGSVEGLDDIWVLTDPDGNLIVPADITDPASIQAATIYAEVAPPGTTAYGGVTFEFVGTGDDVCIWVDPEVAFWNQAVAARPDPLARKWAYPDNIYDDGDIDLFAGLSVYYTGSPGEEIGDFVVAYEDSLGNEIPISLAACPNQVGLAGDDATGGRGSPEFCTLPATDLGISYTVLLRTWATPLDDDRLSFAVLLANGDCTTLRQVAGAGASEQDECVLMGEALTPEPIKGNDGAEVYYGFDAVNEAGRIWPYSMDFEAAFCNPDQNMKKFCEDELERLAEDGATCQWETVEDPANRCFCGDPNDTPEGGAG